LSYTHRPFCFNLYMYINLYNILVIKN
jgi:hypothetical protein